MYCSVIGWFKLGLAERATLSLATGEGHVTEVLPPCVYVVMSSGHIIVGGVSSGKNLTRIQ